MSTKYSTADDARTLADSEGNTVKLTDHAIHRFRERTPADHDFSIREAWRRGEEIKHPDVAVVEDDRPAERVRVFRHSDGWSAVFMVVLDKYGNYGSKGRVVATVLVISQYDHGPTRAYLESHGPHDLGAEPC